ncbi:MAG TPA: protein-disulfide reductase DsbD domain-containing protein [Rickettsiales bacterium]|nr:protein-disulfide reductase DsbD domain-containing protein [Rickettsiales bacterium]
MKLLVKALFILALFLFSNIANAGISRWQDASNQGNFAKLRILDSSYLDEKGEEKFIIGLEFKIENGWKIYGKDSQGIGFAPNIEFSYTKNYQSHEIIWPQAIAKEEKIGNELIKYNVYENEIILPVTIILKDAKAPSEFDLKVSYGLCKDICIPVFAEFKIGEITQDKNALQLIQKFLTKKIIAEESTSQETTLSLISVLIAAFIGGLILNIMPCVLPVLGIKLIAIINNHNARIARIRLAFLATFLGIILCFITFALFAISIELAGENFNWGLQFQNPYFLIVLLVIILFFIANMLEILQLNFNHIISNFLHKKIQEKEKNIFIPNFLSGILAVLLATPCSAPFLGTAISFSITQNAQTILLIFTIMGIGFAFPYIILLISPKLVQHLPKSGTWTLKAKKLMASFLIATAIWLIYVLSNNIGYIPAIIAALLSALFFGCFRIKYKSFKTLSFAIIIAAMFALPKSTDSPKHKKDKIWQDFSEQKLEQYIKERKTVIVDVTASWCLTCNFNKVIVLRSDEVVARLSEENIIAMRADISVPNQKVTDFINKHNRFAIPFNAAFGPCAKSGLLASELLNKTDFLKIIDKASCK